MAKEIYILFLFFFPFVSYSQQAQKDSVKYNSDFKFKEGIYIDFEQVKKNSPVPKSKIISSLNYNSRNFFENILEKETISLYDKLGMKVEIQKNKIWGYSEKGHLYIFWNGEFNRIHYVGNICHFVANLTTYQESPNFYGSHYYGTQQPTTTTIEMRQYILDLELGKVLDFDYKSVEVALMKDPELYDEFNKLRKRKKRKQKFFFIRKYNEKHPLYFPK